MDAPGGMVTAFLKGGLDEARRFLERVEVFALAESLGGVESLIEHPPIMTHASIPPENRAALGISDSLLRLSVAIAGDDDLVADLANALAGRLGSSDRLPGRTAVHAELDHRIAVPLHAQPPNAAAATPTTDDSDTHTP